MTEKAAAVAPLINRRGIQVLLDVSEGTIKSWRRLSLAAVRDGTFTDECLPEADRVVDDQALWYPSTIIKWAVRNSRLARQHGLVIPPVTDLWSLVDIAAHFGVAVDTVRDRWRFHYTHAVSRGEDPPANALPKEDLMVGEIPMWYPPTITAWGKQQGKLGPDEVPLPRNGIKWVNPAGRRGPGPDPMRALLDAGERWDVKAIADFFRVKPTTVSMWRSAFSAGQNFPEHDGGLLRSGLHLWMPDTVKVWGEAEGRIVDGQVVTPKGGRPALPPQDRPQSTPGQQQVRAALLAQRHEEFGEPMRFAENSKRTCVHVAAAKADDGEDTALAVTADDLARAWLGPWIMVCGIIMWRNAGDPENSSRPVEEFDDELLCGRCVRAFGPQSWRVSNSNPVPQPQ